MGKTIDLDSIKKVTVHIDAAHGKTSKVVVVNGDTLADIDINKSDSNMPGLIINGPKFDGEFLHKSHLIDVAIIVPIVFFATAAFITWIVFRFEQRRKEMSHKERMAAIERGIVLPPEQPTVVVPNDPNHTVYVRHGRPYNPYRWPLILGLCGLAFIITHIIEGESISGFGMVLLAIGGALFLAHFLRRKDIDRYPPYNPPTPPEPPQPPQS